MKYFLIPAFVCMFITLTACQVTSAKDNIQPKTMTSTLKTSSQESVGEFSVKSKCVSWLGNDCSGSDIIKTNKDGSQDVLMENYPHTYVDKLSDNLYQVRYSCGNYCRVYEFYSPLKSDASDAVVAFNPETKCLVEIDWGENNNVVFSSRKLFDEGEKVIYQSSNLYPSATLGSKVTLAEFDGNTLNLELLGKNSQDMNVAIEHVCE